MPSNDDLKKLKDLIKDIKIAMFVTLEDNILRSRPMATHEMDEEGVLWFFTYKNSHKLKEVGEVSSVNVSYQDKNSELYVSVSGDADLVFDTDKINQLWNPTLKAWFPQGKDDPNIALLRVNINQAEYWDTPNSKMVQLLGLAKAVLTGTTYQPGENKKINL